MSTVNRMNQMWHYPGPVDTVSTMMKPRIMFREDPEEKMSLSGFIDSPERTVCGLPYPLRRISPF